MEYEFAVKLRGTGDNMVEAWLDAVDALAEDPGAPDSYTELSQDEEDSL